jgi:hypothetical protein
MKQDSVDDSTTVATCRQTVEGFYDAVHRLAASGYAWQRVATVGSRGIELLPRSVLTLGLVSGENAMHEQSSKRGPT